MTMNEVLPATLIVYHSCILKAHKPADDRATVTAYRDRNHEAATKRPSPCRTSAARPGR